MVLSVSSFAAALAAAPLLRHAHSFVAPPSIHPAPPTAPAGASASRGPGGSTSPLSPLSPLSPGESTPSSAGRNAALFLSASSAPSSSSSTTKSISLSLEKPLGLILEEAEGGDAEAGGGVVVTQVNEGGSAFDSPYGERLVGSKVGAVMGRDVSAASFDDVMDAIVNAPSPVEVEFAVPSDAADAEGEGEAAGEGAPPTYEVGATVTIAVQQPETNKPDIELSARVGDNLRKTLLANSDIELYRGLKKKLGNCGGGGQCGYCAVELIDEEGVWGERSEYEAKKIGKNGSEKCRLACMNNIVGPAYHTCYEPVSGYRGRR
ncbi:hypothetical protein ACHAWF_012427 [Thalassiosira exigua]